MTLGLITHSTKIHDQILRHCCVQYHSSGMRQIYLSVLVIMTLNEMCILVQRKVSCLSNEPK